MDHFWSDYAARHSIQTWKNVGVDFLNLSQFILQWHYVWCSDLNLVCKAFNGFTDGLSHVRSAIDHGPKRTTAEKMWFQSKLVYFLKGRPWSDSPWLFHFYIFCMGTMPVLRLCPIIPGCEFGFLLRIYRFYVWCEITWFVQMKMKRAKMQRRTHTP